MIRRRFVATCDEPGCDAMVIAEVSDLEKYEFGMSLNDAGWDAAPNPARPDLCPEHGFKSCVIIPTENRD